MLPVVIARDFGRDQAGPHRLARKSQIDRSIGVWTPSRRLVLAAHGPLAVFNAHRLSATSIELAARHTLLPMVKTGRTRKASNKALQGQKAKNIAGFAAPLHRTSYLVYCIPNPPNRER